VRYSQYQTVRSGNHDEAVFADPETVELQRANAAKYLAFGQGIHFCLGAPVARLEARVVLQELIARLPRARLVTPQDITFIKNTTIRSPTRLLVEWDSAAVSR